MTTDLTYTARAGTELDFEIVDDDAATVSGVTDYDDATMTKRKYDEPGTTWTARSDPDTTWTETG